MIAEIRDIMAEPKENIEFLGQRFNEEGAMPGSFNADVFRITWDKLLKIGFGCMWKIEDRGTMVGGLGGVVYPDPNDGDLVAQETFWYVAKEHRGGTAGVRLLRQFELWAYMKGAKRIIMAHLLSSMPDSLKRFYEHSGYKSAEVSYIKILQ